MNKFLLLAISTLLSVSIANAKTTVCYKKDWNSPSTIETTSLDGGECAGKYSIKQMKEMGWNVLNIKIDSSSNNLSYQYLLTNDTLVSNDNQNLQIEKSSDIKNQLSYKAIGAKIVDVKDNKTTIDIGNLIIGQSGVVIHIYDNDKRLIVANAEVIESNETSSVIKFSKFNDIKQDAIPTSKRTVQKDDILVLNYLYTASLLIAPNLETFQTVRSSFKYNNFLHSDIFATKLKVDNMPFLTKKYIQDYAIDQNLGTIFLVANQKVYVLDTKTLKILTSYDISYEESKTEMPFYTRVTDIEKSNLDIDFDVFSSKEDLKYDQYYKQLLGLK
ncbi:MAG: plasminogen-binding N-terminal domain-containing protein [Poseidonibacter sp.]